MNKNFIVIAVFSVFCGCGGSSGSSGFPDSPEIPSNTAATFSGDLNASIDAGTASANGTVTVTDPDSGEALVVAQTDVSTNFGSFSISTAGAWIYTLDNTNSDLIALGMNDSAVETVSISSQDGTTQSLNITVNGINESAVIEIGDNSISNTTTSISETLSITDPDTGQSAFEEQTDVGVTYGTFSLNSIGNWTYTLDTDNVLVSSLLDETASLTQEITVASVDGTQTTFSIIITGEPLSGALSLTKGSIGNNDSVPEVICTSTVSSTSALEDAVSFSMTAGETLCLASGSYNGLDLTFGGTGTAEAPITVAAAVPGEVIIDGEVFVGMTGEYVIFQGFVFQNGTLDSSILQTRANSSTPCNNCRITENAFIDMDEGMDDSTKWMQIYGSDNRIDHNWFSGKTTRGALLIIERGDAPGTEDRTLIDHNYFGDRPPIDGKANIHLTKYLAKACKVPKGDIDILKGLTGRHKQVLISSAKVIPAEIQNLL